jgi:hypothetical protein
MTDGGLRVATTSADAFKVLRALRRRLATQTRTAWAVRSAAMLMARGEEAERKRAAAAAIAAEEERQARLEAERAAAAARHAAQAPEALSLWPVAHG